MSPVEKALRRADAMQQRNATTAFLIGVIKKFGDDNSGSLVSSLAYTAFVSVFPLLLVLVRCWSTSRRRSIASQSVIRGATTQFP